MCLVANFERPFAVGDELEDREFRVPAPDSVAPVAVRDTGQLNPQRRCGPPRAMDHFFTYAHFLYVFAFILHCRLLLSQKNINSLSESHPLPLLSQLAACGQ